MEQICKCHYIASEILLRLEDALVASKHVLKFADQPLTLLLVNRCTEERVKP